MDAFCWLLAGINITLFVEKLPVVTYSHLILGILCLVAGCIYD